MADCERGLGRPERAIDMLNSEYAAYLDADGRAELLIVVAGARADLGQHDAAVVVLEQGNLDPPKRAKPRHAISTHTPMHFWLQDAATMLSCGSETQPQLMRKP
ncbi:MAG: hypothetical protein U1U88_002479 [Lawsonella clevelandensis]